MNALMTCIGSPDTAGSVGEDRQQFVTFAIGGQSYSVDILSVREIRMLQAITSVPGAPDHIRGVFNLRGRIFPVLDLRRRFGLPETVLMPSHPAVIIAVESRQFAMLVDDVLDIVTVATKAVQKIPEGDPSHRNPFFKGLVTLPDGLLIVVDCDQLLDHVNQPKRDSRQ